MNYVSLFSGAGGLDIGLERAGFKAISHNELETVFCETLRANSDRGLLDSSEIINEDIRNLRPKDLSRGQKVDLVVGGPPCQSYSSSGKQLSVLDPRGQLVDEFCRIVKGIRPKMFLFENVRGIVTARDEKGESGGVIRRLLSQFESIGYSARAGLLNSADFGAPQRRVRCFILGARNGVAPQFPEPTHQKSGSLFHDQWISLGQFLEEHADKDSEAFVFPTEQLGKQLRDLPNGTGLKSAGKAERTRPGGHWGYRQGTFIADLSLPARTVTGSASQDWVRWDGRLRRLTFKEVKLLQGFPVEWEVLGTKAQQFKQIGNAVPTVFGESIGRVIFENLTAYPTRKRPVFLGMPNSFKGYIDYTIRDHERNKDSRSVHKNFSMTN